MGMYYIFIELCCEDNMVISFRGLEKKKKFSPETPSKRENPVIDQYRVSQAL
jgi:hypothetical protein